MVFWHLTPLLRSLEHVNKMTNSKWTWSASKWVLIEIFEWGTAMCSLARRIHFLRVCPVCSMCSSPCINILFSIKISYLSTDKLGANWVSVLSLPPWLRIAYVGVSPSLPSASIHVRIQQQKSTFTEAFPQHIKPFFEVGWSGVFCWSDYILLSLFVSVCLCNMKDGGKKTHKTKIDIKNKQSNWPFANVFRYFSFEEIQCCFSLYLIN